MKGSDFMCSFEHVSAVSSGYVAATPAKPHSFATRHRNLRSEMSLGRLHGFATAVSGRLRRGHSTAAAHPPWAMINAAINFFPSSAQRVSADLAASPGVSYLVVPAHLVDFGPYPDPNSCLMRFCMGCVGATNGDGLLLLNFADIRDLTPVIPTHSAPPRQKSTCSTSNLHSDSESGATPERKRASYLQGPYITRTVCNPITGQLFCLPDIDGTKTTHCRNFGLITRSSREHGAPDRYAVASLEMEGDGDEKSFVMRRFLSGAGEWEKFVVHLSSPLPLARPLDIIELHEVLAFAGRLWWIDPTWGAVSADPFSDQPELRFIELPRGRLLPGPSSEAEFSALEAKALFRRMGVSEGRLHYVEVSSEPPFKVSSFALGDDGCSWTLEHEATLLGPLCARHPPYGIGAIDPLNASVVCLFVGDYVLAVGMDKRMELGHSQIRESELEQPTSPNMYLCVLPPWLGSSRIPSTGKMEGAEKKTLADVLVRSS